MIKGERLAGVLAPPKYALMLYLLFVAADQRLQLTFGDFIRRETDLDYLLNYISARTDDAFNQLIKDFGFSLEEQQKI